MNKMKTLSSISLGIAAVSLFSSSNLKKVKAISESVYALTNEIYDITCKDNVITLKFKNNYYHQNIQNVKLVDNSNKKSFNFDRNSSEFKLYLKENLNDGLYSLVFTDRASNSLTSRELSSPVYVDFPEISSQNVQVTSLNPLISITNLNGNTKLNARFTVLNIQDEITNARILDENDMQIGELENVNNPRNFVFDLGSYAFSPNKIYYIEYWLTNSKNQTNKIKIPFTYSTNSIQLSPFYTNNFTYTATINANRTADLVLKFKNTDISNISFYDADNLAFQFSPSYANDGSIILNNVPINKIVQVEIRDGNRIEFLNFKVPSQNVNLETQIPFMKFINASNIVLKRGSVVSLPIIKEDLENSGFADANSFIKLVYFDDFGNEIGISDEARISLSSYKADVTINSNIDSFGNNSKIYVKVSNGSKQRLYPFQASNASTTSQSLAFDVIKNSYNNSRTSITFRPNGSLLNQGETFSSNDSLIINNDFKATLSSDKKSFSVSIPNNKLLDGKNSYTLIRNYANGNSLTYQGEFLINASTGKQIEINQIVKSINSLTQNDKEVVLQVDLDDEFLHSDFHTSVNLTDELGKAISCKSSVRTIGGNKVIELIISPAGQFINGKPYTMDINTGTNNISTSFIFNRDRYSNTDLDLIFNGYSTFTLRNLGSLPGFSLYNFNLKIYDYYDARNVLYENYDRPYYGERFTTDSITRNLSNGKKFIDGNRYTVEIRNTTTNDIYKEDFIFRQGEIISPNGENSSILNIHSSALSFANDGINFQYSTNRNITGVYASIPDIKTYFSSGRIYADTLVPNKIYKDLILTVNFSDGSNQQIRIGDFVAQQSPDRLKNYLAKVYTTTLTPIDEKNKYRVRYADEAGFNYWYDMLSTKKISGPEFIYRILDANEFNIVQKTPQDKIKALYPIVVNRDGDINGINFWIGDYTKNLNSLNSEDVALKITLARMLNEEEPKQLFLNLGIRVQ